MVVIFFVGPCVSPVGVNPSSLFYSLARTDLRSAFSRRHIYIYVCDITSLCHIQYLKLAHSALLLFARLSAPVVGTPKNPFVELLASAVVWPFLLDSDCVLGSSGMSYDFLFNANETNTKTQEAKTKQTKNNDGHRFIIV